MTFIEEAIISGFIGEAISRCIDVSWIKIKEAVKNRKKEHQNIESQIYNVIVNVLNQITYNKYRNEQDKIYQSAEKLLLGYKDIKCDNVEVVRYGLQVLGECVNDNKYMEFKMILYQELSKKDYEELYRQIELLHYDKENNRTSRIEQKVDVAIQKIDDIKINGEKVVIAEDVKEKFQNDKKQDYIKIWNSRLFLHVDNDENPITLKDAFIMPDYKIYKEINRIGFSYDDTLDKIIEKFIKYDKTSTMLIYGVPGIGKSTITSWVANKYKSDDRCIILRFRDWESEELKKGLLKSICKILECKKRDLEYKILILDGYDEMKALDIGEKILNSFFNDIKDFHNIKCIITSRTGYIGFDDFRNVFELKNFDIDKIDEFCKKITGKGIDKKEKVESNLEVLGIPVILYMAIMSNVDISENPTKPELYNRIFAEKGGIFDKFFDGVVEYDNGSQIFRNPENTMKYLEFLCIVAFKMFEKNELSLLEEEYEVPRLRSGNELISILEFPIKHLFESRYNYIEFIHKSIYEYFVSEYIYISINKKINMIASRKDIASVLGVILKENIFSYEILEFLKYKIRNYELNTEFKMISEAFQVMIQDGMTYYSNKFYKNVMDYEMNVFYNMLQILHLWNNCSIKFDDSVIKYIKYNYKFNLNLRKVCLRKMDLAEANLRGVDLTEADLIEANLIGANLTGANLIGANLRKANLAGANLTSVKLIGADLTEADLTEADLVGVDLTHADLSRANLVGANLSKAILIGANLTGANLIGTNLSRADLSRADLSDTNLTDANLRRVSLVGADLNRIKFHKSNIR